MTATPATRLLEERRVSFEEHRYPHDPSAASYGMEAAELLDLEPDVVFKTLMARLDGDSGELVVAIVPVAEMLNLKALAKAAGAKRASMAAVADAERVTGYVAGGISPFGQRKTHRTFIDESAEICERIYVSGGQRGFDLSLHPADLVATLNAVISPLT